MLAMKGKSLKLALIVVLCVTKSESAITSASEDDQSMNGRDASRPIDSVVSVHREDHTQYLSDVMSGKGIDKGRELWSFTTGGNCGKGRYTTSYMTCELCKPGTAKGWSGESWWSCPTCPVGTYTPDEGYHGCNKCDGGTYNDQRGASSEGYCKDCPPGHYSYPGSSKCTKCPSNKYASGYHNGRCFTCSAGKVPTPNRDGCEACPAGKYERGREHCLDCQDGYYSNGGTYYCTRASAGHYAPEPKTAQYLCPAGSFSSAGAKQCQPCPFGKSTFSVGSTSDSQCVKCPNGVDPYTFACLPSKKQCGSAADKYADYRGPKSTTEDGSTCRPWDASEHRFKIERHPNAGLESNYCRNPDNGDRAWCYTSAGGDWDYCDIPNCESEGWQDQSESNESEFADICWEEEAIITLKGSVALQDVHGLMFEESSPSSISINGLIEESMSLLQDATSTAPTMNLADLLLFKEKLQKAGDIWLGTLDNVRAASCQKQIWENEEWKSQYEDIIKLQFGDDKVNERLAWITHWRCSGATFGCSGTTHASCPQAKACFQKLEEIFVPFIDHFALTNEGSAQTSIFSLEYLRKELKSDVKDLVQFDKTQKQNEKRGELMDEIKKNREFMGEIFDATSSITAAGSKAAMESAKTQAQMYYERIQKTHKTLQEMNAIIKIGPMYGDETMSELQSDCRKETELNMILDMISAVVSIGSAIASKSPPALEDIMQVVQAPKKYKVGKFKKGKLFPSKKKVGGVTKKQKFMRGLGTTGATLGALKDQAKVFLNWMNIKKTTVKWNAETMIPPIPDLDATNFSIDGEEWKKTVEWYQLAQKDLTKGLVLQTGATWESIYLDAKKQMEHFIKWAPGGCPKAGTKMGKAVFLYLQDVKNFTNYGRELTAAQEKLVPALGDIASGLATVEAIKKANRKVHATPFPVLEDQLKSTVPSSFEDKVLKITGSRATKDSKEMLSSATALTMSSRMYESARTIHSFCASYKYMSANGVYDECRSFQDKYLPSYSSFERTVEAMANDDYSRAKSTFTAITSKQQHFAKSTQKLEWYGAKQVETGFKTVEVQIYNTNWNTTWNTTSPENNMYYGSLQNGSVAFKLTPGSTLFRGFGVQGTNPRVVNVQAFWRGKRNTKSDKGDYFYIPTKITVDGPHTLYEQRTGKAVEFTLEDFEDNFAVSENVEKNPGMPCAGGTVERVATWNNGDSTTYCTKQSSDFKASADDIEKKAFKFPSLYADWGVTVEPRRWNHDVFETNLVDLALTVKFTYIPSRQEPHRRTHPVGHCNLGCLEIGKSMDLSSNPLATGEAFCTGSQTCGDCSVTNYYKKQNFCMCNVWTGEVTACEAKDGVSTRNDEVTEEVAQAMEIVEETMDEPDDDLVVTWIDDTNPDDMVLILEEQVDDLVVTWVNETAAPTDPEEDDVTDYGEIEWEEEEAVERESDQATSTPSGEYDNIIVDGLTSDEYAEDGARKRRRLRGTSV